MHQTALAALPNLLATGRTSKRGDCMRRTWAILSVLVLPLALTACVYRVTTSPGAQGTSTPPPRRACLGVTLQDTRSGVDVVKVLPGSPAAAARLPRYASIVGFADHRVSTVAQVNRIEAGLTPGTLVVVAYTAFPAVATVRRLPVHLGQWDHRTCVPVVNGP